MNSLLGFFFFTFLFFQVEAADFKTPWLQGPVMDETGTIEPQHRQELENLLQAFNQKGIAQVQVYVTSSLQGLPIEKASIDITDQWKLGDKDKDNGVLFLIAPNDRKVRIEVGQGLEGVLPDIYAKRINEDIVLPYFKQGQISAGVYNGTKAILAIVGGEQNVQSLDQLASERAPSRTRGFAIPPWIIVIIWILIFFLGRLGGGRRRLHRGVWIGGGGFGGGGFGGGGGWSGGGGGFSGGGSSGSW